MILGMLKNTRFLAYEESAGRRQIHPFGLSDILSRLPGKKASNIDKTFVHFCPI